ncbi:MAG: hypothetical protein KKH57_04040 [Candidatus Omnitrophica bacterium]|nr:hypothetical protein [Candidatus Omnitrophota bacterium]
MRRLLKKERPIEAYFSYGFLATSLLFPSMILLIRASKSVFAFGEFIGPVGTACYTFSAMSVLCFVIGGQFSLACAAASNKTNREVVLGRVYMYEALGAVIGGVIFTYILIGSVPTFIIALALSVGCIFISFGILIKKISFRIILLIVAALAILAVNFMAEPAVNRMEWKGYQFIKQKEGRNATLSLVNMGSTKNVFMDGVLTASFPNPEGYEPAAHWPLLASAEPNQILIIGDTSLGVIKEALKYNPKQIDYVVLDNSFIELIEPYLDFEDLSALRNPLTHTHYLDARSFIRNNKNKYNTVIINIQEVPNLKANRFYSEEFYSQLRGILKSNGVLGLSVASSENYLSMQTRIFNASVYVTLKSVFKAVEVIPGDSLIFLASPSEIDMRRETLLGRLDKRNISNHYVISSYIEYKLQAKRRGELKRILQTAPGVEINRDFRPTTCYYFANLWLNKFASPLGYLTASIIFILIALNTFKKRRLLFFLSQRKEPILIFVLGFISMLLELVLLLSYQIISGYVYWQMGILFSSFMLGLFLGSLLGNQFKDNSPKRYSILLTILCLAIIGLSICAVYLLPYLIYLSTLQNIAIFIAFLVFIGVIVGTAFVIASFLIRADDVMLKAGSLYAADLWGAALGAILSTNFITPIFGVLGALNFSAVIGLVGLAIFLILSGKTS